ncbi:MAG: helix-turn-helix domain-containing protein, partial [Candidatus Poribacteria bacterium]
MITLEGWVMIKHLHKEGVPKSRIAEELGLDRRTVDKAIDEDKPPTLKCTPLSRQKMGFFKVEN